MKPSMTAAHAVFRLFVGLVLAGASGFLLVTAPEASASEPARSTQGTPGFWNPGFGVARGCSWLVNASTVDSQGRLYVGLSSIGQTCGDSSGAFFRYDPVDQSFTSLGDFSQDDDATQGASVFVLIYHDQGIYVGGLFARVDGLEVNNVARFDTADETWSGLGNGLSLEGAQGFARTLLVTDDEIWAGGAFTRSGEVETTGVARFDRNTAQWEALGDGLNNTAWALVLGTDGTLYVGGQFTEAGGQAARGLAAWNGSDWSTIDTFLPSPAVVKALAFLDGRLYVGGSLSKTIDGTAYQGVLSWDGTAWAGLGASGLSAAFGGGLDVTSLATHNGDLYVGGSFKRAGGTEVRNLGRWSPGSEQWSGLGSGDAIGLRRGLVSRILRYGAVTLTVHGDALYVGGLFTRAGNEPANNIARFDLNGNSWSAIGGDSGHGLNAQNIWFMSVHEGDVLASGVPTQGGLNRLHGVGRWNPVTESWSPFGSPQGPGFLGGVNQSAAAGGSVFVATTSFIIADIDAIDSGFSDAIQAGGLVRWDEQDGAWIPVENQNRDLTNITAMVGSGDRLYAAGSFSVPVNGTSEARRAVRVWDTVTSTWSALGENLDGSTSLSAIAVGEDGGVYVAGSFENVWGGSARGIARWDPIDQEWTALGQGLSNSDGEPADVRALAIGPGGDLYAGGRFDTAGGGPANNIARWDGSQWHALGDGIVDSDPDLAPPVFALVVAENGDVFVGGRFTEAGGQAAKHLARWDGVGWSVVGDSAESNGVDRVWAQTPVRGLALLGADLFVGGSFGRAGDFASAHFAKFTRDLGGASVEIDIDVEELSGTPSLQNLALSTRSFTTALRYVVDVRNPGRNMARNVDFRITADPAPEQVEWTCQVLIGNAVCPAASGVGLPELVFNLPGLSTLRFEILATIPDDSGVYEQTLAASSTLEPVFQGDVPVSQSSSSTLVNDRIFRSRFLTP